MLVITKQSSLALKNFQAPQPSRASPSASGNHARSTWENTNQPRQSTPRLPTITGTT